MTIYWLEFVDSTQNYLKALLKNKKEHAPLAVATLKQTHGSGSRGNQWIGIEGNLFFSFAIAKTALPNDLKLESASIYFMYLLKEELRRQGSELWLKWPNDFYIDDKKIGGCITNIQGENLICGIGINVKDAPENFGVIDIEFEPQDLLEIYLKCIKKKILWKHVFSKYKLEFENNKSKISYTSNKEISFLDAKMMEDGSLMSNGRRMYSQR
ncbi:MAG: biotin--[acetyl-CoA-carboxylase] ligase [Campylobacterota bacterium]|nr:biotin--[acetyl-CoA-carboxylase] ligase [Campylobacterota bacterium]